jgi:hypothetical protein
LGFHEVFGIFGFFGVPFKGVFRLFLNLFSNAAKKLDVKEVLFF